ncbi:rhomboid family intramembrane serine protease [Flagellimonas meishanensis]|uniref:rhomboid family intramembrane serine protease n=1 Tax=Flagellimonas meishanensis TaxID=2873264 RepID=UPI001CA5FC45|nr:rhomboid family intramembrane serine protease [[Muricauda] meishanensis]
MGRLTEAVKHLLIINVILFFATMIYGGQMQEWLALSFPESNGFRWWQIISHMFMHWSVVHILFNMYALWAFGTPLEQNWGRNKFLFFYFSAGLGSVILYTSVNYYFFNQGLDTLINAGFTKSQLMEALASPNGIDSEILKKYAPSDVVDNFVSSYYGKGAGASGAIYGILVAFAFMYSEARLMLIFLPVPIKAKYFVPLLIAVDLIFGIGNVNTGIAHFAHIGGALIGFLMMWYWKKNEFNDKHWD